MKKLYVTTDEIRARFLKFFEARGHKIVASDSLVPTKDPSVLFTGAGMNQFKEQFLGCNVTYRRIATSQKCLRTADLEKVGRTAGHHTFFEMLGNFSFGDYFKKEAIVWAWEFMTSDLKIPKDKLLVSVYLEDEEAYNIWLNDVKIPPKKVLKLGDKENFWPSEAKKNGPNGPCGPCSELFYDTGKGEPIEVWNLVFTQFDRKDGGVLENLPSKNIDTGMGLERLASVMQGVDTNFEIDIFIPIIEAIKRELNLLSTIHYPLSTINAIADHIRAVTFAISDGVYPSNEERGFVIRKLIRRSTQKALGIKPKCKPFLYKIVPTVIKVMKGQYPELEPKREIISQIVKAEEERFQVIVSEVVPLLKEEFLEIKNKGGWLIPGELIFKYSDEKGVPLDLQKEIAQELGLGLDEEGFNKLLMEQKERSRQKSKLSKEIFTAAPSGLAQKEDEEWDEASKIKIRMNHTATHLLHSALRRVLGEHVWQAGSLVYPEKLRFDFTHPKKLEPKEIELVEELVNKNIAAGYEVKRDVMKLDEAKRQGAIALFGEKYGEEVIVRTIGDFSKELCSGDHVDNTKMIRVFKIVQETSISAGTRRIEAVTGNEVYNWLASQVEKRKAQVIEGLKGLGEFKSDIIVDLEKWFSTKNANTLVYEDVRQWSTREAELLDLLEKINDRRKKMEKEISKQKAQETSKVVDEILKNSKIINGINILTGNLRDMDIASLRNLSDSLIDKAPRDCIILLASDFGNKATFVMTVGEELIRKGLSANQLIKPIAAYVGGSGGGRPDMAQAGGKDVAKIDEALGLIYKLIEERT